MLPGSIVNLLRLAGVLISLILAIQPWFITTGSEDPFLFQGWALLSAGAMSICVIAVLMLFFRPRQGQIPFLSSFFLFFIAITISTINSNFLISLKSSMTMVALLVLAGFLRLSRQQQDNMTIAGVTALSGGLMALYGLVQYAGYDVIAWNSKHSMVGTFSNPNYFGAFLAVTALFTLGLALDPALRRTRTRIIYLSIFAIQLVTIFFLNRPGITLSFCFGLLLLFTRCWEVRPGRILRISPLLSGLIIALILVFFHSLVYYSTSNFPWDSLQRPPQQHFSVVTRLILWQMGFAVFLAHPITGLGPGALPYLMPMQRPALGTALGIKLFNDDPHSAALSVLAETGFPGLVAICSILAVIYGCFVWFRFKNSREEEQTEDTADSSTTAAAGSSNIQQPVWNITIGAATISLTAFLLGILGNDHFLYSIPLIIAIFGIHNTLKKAEPGEKVCQLVNLPKATTVAMLTFVFNSLFNTSFSVLPLMGFLILIFSLHFSACQRDIAWKRKFSFISLAFICFPAMYVFAAYNFQSAYHQEQVNLFIGESLLEKQSFADSQKAFEAAIKANPQSLKAHYGLAISLEKQNRLDESQDVLKRLDSMVPNAFNSNYELARILLERKQILEAHRYALKSLQWDQAPRAYELLGKILVLEGKYAEAEKIFSEGLLLVPVSSTEIEAADRIRLNLAAALANRGDYQGCEQQLVAIKSPVSDSSEALYLRGILFSRQNKQKEALEIFEQALEQAPHDPRLLNAVGYILTELGQDLERAQSTLETAYQIVKSSNPPGLSDLLMIAHSLGKLYWKIGRLQEAGQLLEIAFEQCPDEWQSLKKERQQDMEAFYKQTGYSHENKIIEQPFAMPVVEPDHIKPEQVEPIIEPTIASSAAEIPGEPEQP